jgi:glucose/arabinose dehydrogenase
VLVAGVALGCERAPVADLAAAPIASDQASFEVVKVAGALEHPWGMAFLPDGELLITERPGRLRILRDGELDPAPLTGVPEVYASGQGGLLDVALDPDFAQNRLIYLSYAARAPSATLTVAGSSPNQTRRPAIRSTFSFSSGSLVNKVSPTNAGSAAPVAGSNGMTTPGLLPR